MWSGWVQVKGVVVGVPLCFCVALGVSLYTSYVLWNAFFGVSFYKMIMFTY